MNSRIKLSSCDKVSLTFVIDENRTATFFTPTKEINEVLLEFVQKGKSLDELQNYNKDDQSFSRLSFFIENLKKNGFVDYHFQFNDKLKAIVYPKSHIFKSSILETTDITLEESPYVLSRFAYFRREDNKMILESPLVPFRVALIGEFFSVFFPLITGEENVIVNGQKLFQEIKTIKIFLKLLIAVGIIHPIADKEMNHLRFWEFHDLIFHSNSRRGEFNDNLHFGATYRFQKEFDPSSIIKDVDFDQLIELHKPNINKLVANDAPFTKILEDRRSIRTNNNNHTINIKELGEFLYRSVGIRKIVKSTQQDALFRPYPGAGAIHEIEFYLVINKCDGLDSDIYYYQPIRHTLSRKNVNNQHVKKILLNAQKAMGTDAATPQIVFILTSRFKKIAWKYEKISYRCTLISIGAIFQTMSLVATSMGLPSCIVGSGDSSLFGEAVQINPLEEGAVGEFALGFI